MQPDNPYTTTSSLTTRGVDANSADESSNELVGDISIFNAKGRLGRLRYLMYGMGIALVATILAAILMMIPAIGVFLAILVYIGLTIISFYLTIQRCHDFNVTGWLSLILFIPIVSLIFLFWPGTKAENDYGFQPPPNSTAIKVGAFLILGLYVLGIVAAIALPAYQEYALRAQ